MTTHDDTVRVEFEKWASERGFSTRMRNETGSPDTYFAYETEQRWITWQAALSTVPDKAEQPDYGRLRAAFHVTMLRLIPEKSHAEISAEIDRAIGANAAQPVARDDVRDAERYRWRRTDELQPDKQNRWVPRHGFTVSLPNGGTSTTWCYVSNEQEYDAAIDTAIKCQGVATTKQPGLRNTEGEGL